MPENEPVPSNPTTLDLRELLNFEDASSLVASIGDLSIETRNTGPESDISRKQERSLKRLADRLGPNALPFLKRGMFDRPESAELYPAYSELVLGLATPEYLGLVIDSLGLIIEKRQENSPVSPGYDGVIKDINLALNRLTFIIREADPTDPRLEDIGKRVIDILDRTPLVSNKKIALYRTLALTGAGDTQLFAYLEIIGKQISAEQERIIKSYIASPTNIGPLDLAKFDLKNNTIKYGLGDIDQDIEKEKQRIAVREKQNSKEELTDTEKQTIEEAYSIFKVEDNTFIDLQKARVMIGRIGSKAFPLLAQELKGLSQKSQPDSSEEALVGELVYILNGLAEEKDLDRLLDLIPKNRLNQTVLLEAVTRLAFTIRIQNPEDPRLNKIAEFLNSRLADIKASKSTVYEAISVTGSSAARDILNSQQVSVSKTVQKICLSYLNDIQNASKVVYRFDVESGAYEQVGANILNAAEEKKKKSRTDIFDVGELEDKVDQLTDDEKSDLDLAVIKYGKIDSIDKEVGVQIIEIIGSRGLPYLKERFYQQNGEYNFAIIASSLATPAQLDTVLEAINSKVLGNFDPSTIIRLSLALQRISYIIRKIDPDDPRLLKIANSFKADLQFNSQGGKTVEILADNIAATGRVDVLESIDLSKYEGPLVTFFDKANDPEFFRPKEKYSVRFGVPSDLSDRELQDLIDQERDRIKKTGQQEGSSVDLADAEEEEVADAGEDPEKEKKERVRLFGEIVQEAKRFLGSKDAVTIEVGIDGSPDYTERLINIGEFGSEQSILIELISRNRIVDEFGRYVLLINWIDRQRKKLFEISFRDNDQNPVGTLAGTRFDGPAGAGNFDDFAKSWDEGSAIITSPDPSSTEIPNLNLYELAESLKVGSVNKALNQSNVEFLAEIGDVRRI